MTVILSEKRPEKDPTAPDRVSKDEQKVDNSGETDKAPDNHDELPADLKNLSDRFVDSVTAKVYQVSPPIDKLSGLFQDFYAVAVNHINTHTTSQSSRPKSQSLSSTSSSTSLSSISSTAKRLRAKATSNASLDRSRKSSEQESSDQQLLTPEEIAEKKEARKALENKRLALEELIERRVCENTYDQIWRHQSTHDEAKDEKLRSRTAALSLVGIGLKDLGVDIGEKENMEAKILNQKENEIREQLQKARNELFAMNDTKYPLGKLLHLKMAHKSIVDTLAQFHPSSSADEVMPMLIYTLITSRPEGINIISNLYFIQRFRNETKIDGEAAYCLTNLEAAISFLETVDLASLRADEMLSGPPKSVSRPNTPSIDIFDPLLNLPTPQISSIPTEKNNVTLRQKIAKPGPIQIKRQSAPPQTRSRGLSDLLQSSPAALGAAGDAVFNSADQGLETIGNSLGDSYKFLMGKLKGRNDDVDDNKTEIIEITSELVGTLQNNEDLKNSPSPLPSTEIRNRVRADSGAKVEEKLLLVNGSKPHKNKNIDSSKRLTLLDDSLEKSSVLSPSLPSPNPALMESMRNLGNTLNPINRISGMGVMRAFGRGISPSPHTLTNQSAAAVSKINAISNDEVTELTTVTPNITPVLLQKEMTIKIAPPITKFMELQTPGDMKLNEVMELLRDYRRLAGALKDLGAI
ncbi:hypothetical protein K3495_g7390 [Podosphaera aphanis]|nr:hypothetical protein K3495_g7390 [Podosphaera aphanis]